MTEDGSKVGDLINAIGVSLGEPSIAVVGCGGAGSNIVHGIYWGLTRIETIAVNTDEEHLRRIDAHKRILIGKDVTFGQDAGGFPEIGEHCAEKARQVLREALRSYDIIFVVAGMGGGTGTGVSPVVATVAKELNALTFAIPIMPFAVEGGQKTRIATDGVERLRNAADFTVVLDNNKLAAMEGARGLPMSEAMNIMEKSVVKIVQTITSQTSSYVNTLMHDISGYADAIEEPIVVPPNEPADERLIHADLTPAFESYEPHMFG
ncbi:MAG: hypothetical protein JSV94_00835 [Methanobacteriota archaeon]|nr:MAG: hypothetical protein JSV94_00835 [Euryarchaeota archaeon]